MTGQCLHELVEAQAARTPYAVAVAAGGVQLSYRELNQRANQLARHLRVLGVGPESLVGVAAERSAETVVALLGVLKAGGAYVPLDPDYPPERLRFIAADAGARVLVCRNALVERLAMAAAGGRLVVLDHDWPQIAQQSTAGLGPLAIPANLAYVIYTSGSTGQPKGVLVGHAQIVNSTTARSAFGRWSPGDYEGGAYAVPVPLSFDASAAGLWWTLTTGGRLVLPSDQQVQDPRSLAQLIEGEHITHFTHMPSYYRLLLAADGRALRTLRDVSAGGEAFPPQLVAEHYRLLPWTRLYNDYGPTETTVWVTAYLCRPDPDGMSASVPIGTPIQNTRVHLLDADLNPVPVGVVGELHIAGANVARGYHRRPALTAERFIPDPFSATPGQRLYRTGDLARRRPDGCLEFVGRADSQVKVRGFRVELGEIEAALQDHPGVAAAAVTAAPDGVGEARLVGYVVPRHGWSQGRPPDRDELAAFLQRRLPAYMVPSVFVALERLPQTSHGKIDRDALPNPGQQGSSWPASADRLVGQLSDEGVAAMLAALSARTTEKGRQRGE